jgi:hypothetical protein
LKSVLEILILDEVMTIPVLASRWIRLSGKEGRW